MTSYRVTLEDMPSEADWLAVEQGLDAYNVTQTGRIDERRVGIFVRDQAGQVIGGLTGWTWWDWLAIDNLWLSEALRGQRLGSQLVRQAEAEALARGCKRALLTTMSFQAPEFYRKLGYTEFAVMEGFAGLHRRHYFWKLLAGEESPTASSCRPAVKDAHTGAPDSMDWGRPHSPPAFGRDSDTGGFMRAPVESAERRVHQSLRGFSPHPNG
jgi:GNAT superfamily N-acetyltransferase